MMHLSQVATAVHGKIVGADTVLRNVAINTRAECQGRLFVALKGDNFDAHNYVAQAAEAGATALMVEKEVDSILPMVKVDSTHEALMDLATWWRSQFVLPLIGITGSVGKTTVKEMLACIFAELGKGVVTEGNLNNEIGAPLTLMRLEADDLYAIIEMGMNQAGEIARISSMAKPTIALVNNAAAAHLEGLGSIEAVAQAKGEIYQGLSPDGIAVINADDEFAHIWMALAESHKIVTFGLTESADVSARYKEKNGRLTVKVNTEKESFKLRINSLGEHSVRNVLAATAVALAANVPSAIIKEGMANFVPVNGRMNVDVVAGVTVINDTYNANPASMRAAINVLVKNDDNTLIVGDMAELGAATEAEHKSLGAQAAKRGVKTLLSCGQNAAVVVAAFGQRGIAFDNQEDLLLHLKNNAPTGTVLIKGSRSAKMELVVEALQKQLSENGKRTSLAMGGEH
jgi:UDP-N-acetylmuramoyl-tripeptide--D-alanyl-D-alanine ligase